MLQSSSSTVALDTKEKRQFTLRQFPWHWVAILALFGWNGYLQYKVNDANDVVQASSGVSARLSSLEVVTNQTVETLQVKVNSEPVFAFLDVNGFYDFRVFLRNSSNVMQLPTLFLNATGLGELIINETLLERDVYLFEGTPPPPGAGTNFYLGTDLQLLCAYHYEHPDWNQQQWCMQLATPSCGLLNMFAASFTSPPPSNIQISMSILMGLSYAACDSIPAPEPSPEPTPEPSPSPSPEPSPEPFPSP